MTFLESGGASSDFTFSLAKPFAWFAVIRVKEQKRSGRKVIFAVGHKHTPISLSIGLDDKDSLRVWIRDAAGSTHASEPVPASLFRNRFTLLFAELQPVDDGLEVFVGVGRKRIRTLQVNAALGGDEPARYVIGASLDNTQNAAFELGELFIYNKVITEAERAGLVEYASSKWDLPNNGE